jgi:hypothetical protein
MELLKNGRKWTTHCPGCHEFIVWEGNWWSGHVSQNNSNYSPLCHIIRNMDMKLPWITQDPDEIVARTLEVINRF